MNRNPFPVLRRIDPALVIVALLLAAVIFAGCLISDRFGTVRNFTNVLEQTSALGFASLGQALVVLVGGINLSIGAIVTAATLLLAGLGELHPALMVPIIALTLIFGAGVGFLNGYVTLKTGVHPMIVTLGTGTMLNGVALTYTLQPTGGVPFWVEEFAYGWLGPLPISGLTMLVCFALVTAALRYSRTGRSFLAVGGHPEAASMIGIRSARITLLAYGASGFFAALAGVYFVSRTGVGDPRIGDPITLASITPVILGGMVLGGGKGNLIGVLLGVMLVALLSNLLNYMSVSTFLQWVIQGGIIILAVVIRVQKAGRA
ncbi:ABC transporter permease [Tritonibacter scottomollicae]|uniref:ABC transporter permease n=1 Tax=Tritonibacter scottomollicae TaxID=483013 RepID=UPI003BABA40F